MELSLNKNNIFDITVLFFLHVIFIFLSIKFSFFAPAILLFCLFLIWIFKKPHIGISLLVIAHYFILISTEEITIYELSVGTFIGLILLLWIVREFTAVDSFKTFQAREYVLFLFFATALFSIIPAFLYKTNMLKWFRELIPFVILMLYYPIRESFRSRRIAVLYFTAFLALAVIISINNVINYWNLMMEVTKEWQIASSRQPFNE